MNITVIAIEIIAMITLFSVFVFGMLLINPLSFISDYPPEIQAEYYRSQKKEAVKEKLSKLMIFKKVIAIIIFAFIFAWLLHIAGASTFKEGVLLSYLYIFIIFAWDTFVLDWIFFANVKRIRLPGTEHMEKEYRQKWFHVKVCIPMLPVFLVMGAASAGIMMLIR